MEKIKLSDLIKYYEKKCSEKDEFFKYYFEETAIEEKLSKLQMMYEILGDVAMPLDYFRTFLYAGHWYADKNYFKLTKSMIVDIYDIIKKYDDMPIRIIDSLLFHYDEACFEKYKIKEYFDLLVLKHKFSEETLKECVKYIEDSKAHLKQFYLDESKKLELISDQYPYDFIYSLREVITSHQIEFEELMDKLPSNTLFKTTTESKSEFWAKYNDYRFIIGLLKGKISLDDYTDDECMVAFEQIGQTKEGIKVEKMYTSFTKKEYLDSIKKEKVKIK